MSATHFDGVRTAAAVGILTSSILSGALLSSSAFAVPALLTTSRASDAPLPLLRAFSRFYDRGKTAVVPLSILSAAAYTYAAARVSSARFITRGSFAAAHRNFLFAAAAALTVGVLPYTFLVMLDGISVLVKGAEDKIEAKKVGERRVPLVGTVLGAWASFA